MSRPLIVLWLAACLGGCSLLVDTSDLDLGSDADAAAVDAAVADATPADVQGPDTTRPDASTEDAAGSCPSGRGPLMRRVQDEHGTFCIDTTEVSNEQFNAFLADPVRPTPPATCSAKGASFGGSTRPANRIPVTNVDWCDAWMYCRWANKRLCGSRNGAPINTEEIASNPGVSEWFAACSRSGSRTYPYGTTYDKSACNVCPQTAPDGGCATATFVAAGSRATCQGGFDGVFDMSGNVSEWEDNCDGPSSSPLDDTCPPRGGSAIVADPNVLRCAMPGALTGVKTRGAKGADVGIRCCAD